MLQVFSSLIMSAKSWLKLRVVIMSSLSTMSVSSTEA